MKATTTTSLRAALQLALAVARQGEAQQPPVPAPARLRPYLSFAKAPTAALELCRRVVDEDEPFRRRVAAAATVDQVGSLAWLWLTRPDGWEATAAEVQAERERERLHTTVARRHDELERRQAAALEAAQLAEQARRELAGDLELTRAELIEARRQLRDHGAELDEARARADRLDQERAALLRQLKATEATLARRANEGRLLHAELGEARIEVLRLQAELDRRDLPGPMAQPSEPAAVPAADRSGLAAVPMPNDEMAADPFERAQQQAREAARTARVRAAIDAASSAAQAMAAALANAASAFGEQAAPTEPAGSGRSAEPVSPRSSGPDHGRSGAGRSAVLGVTAQSVSPAVSTVRTQRRRALRMPPGTMEDSVRAAEHLARVPHVLFLVDGYNVAKQGWPELELRHQRDRLVDALVGLQARTGAQTDVVFDGIDDGALLARGAPGRLRIEFTASDVEADDRLLELVELTPLRRPVVVVSNDRRVRDGARQRGANTLSSEQLLALLR